MVNLGSNPRLITEPRAFSLYPNLAIQLRQLDVQIAQFMKTERFLKTSTFCLRFLVFWVSHLIKQKLVWVLRFTKCTLVKKKTPFLFWAPRTYSSWWHWCLNIQHTCRVFSTVVSVNPTIAVVQEITDNLWNAFFKKSTYPHHMLWN